MAKKGSRPSGGNGQIELLRGIWAEMKSLNGRIDGVRGELQAVRTELKQEMQSLRAELKDELKHSSDVLVQRTTDSEVRTATAIGDLAGTLRDVRDLLREQLDLRHRVTRCEQAIEQIHQRLTTTPGAP